MKVEIFCLVRKKNITVDSRVANALIKMKRAIAVERAPEKKETQVYQTKVMTADVEFSEEPKRRGRPKKDAE